MNKFIRTLLFLALFIPISTCIGQIINGHVINSENGDPLAYATVKTSDKKQTLTNIDGSFSLKLTAKDSVLTVSYIGFSSKTTPITKFSEYYLIKLGRIWS